jgi:membrane associated rhomboid family serine protease
MQTERTFLDDLKYQYTHGGMAIRLIIINSAVFLLIQILLVFSELIKGRAGGFLNELTYALFSLKCSVGDFIFQPWGLITSVFSHFSLIHFIFNMIFLYSVGRIFEQIFNGNRLLYTYLLGGMAGGILEILAHAVFPSLQGQSVVVVGASGSVMALFAALAFYRPNLNVSLFGILEVRLIILAGIFILYDLLSLNSNDGTAHFAHLGGVILGMISINGISRSSNIINATQTMMDRIFNFFKGIFQPKNKLKVKKGGHHGRPKSDEEFLEEARERQIKIDRILDKISRSGYESLTKAEKDFLFHQSKK